MKPDKQTVETSTSDYSVKTFQVSHHGNVVMDFFNTNVFDIDGNHDMFDQIRKCLQISPSLPDGHCFLYSIIKLCSTQLTPGLDTDVRSILSKMNSEPAACPHFYAAFMKKNDKSAIKTAFHNYTVNKKYNTRFGDVVPLLCANALGFNIVILNDSCNVSPRVVFFIKKRKSNLCFLFIKRVIIMMDWSPWSIYIMTLENPYDNLVLHMISMPLVTNYWYVVNQMIRPCYHHQMAMILKIIPKTSFTNCECIGNRIQLI